MNWPVQARNGTNSDTDRESLDKEYQELSKEITRVLGGTTFNGQNILATSRDDGLPGGRQHDGE